jgi:hypothetical protein
VIPDPLVSSATTTGPEIEDPWAAATPIAPPPGATGAQAIEDPWAASMPTPPAATPPPVEMAGPPKMDNRTGILDVAKEVPLGILSGVARASGQVVNAIGGGAEFVGSLFDRDDDPRTLNGLQRSGRKIQRFGQQATENADLVEFNTTSGKIAQFGGEMGTHVLATLATASTLPTVNAGLLGQSLRMSVAAVPMTAAQSYGNESLVQAGAELLGADELAKTFEGNAFLRIASDIGLDAALGVAADIGLAKLVTVKSALKKKAAKSVVETVAEAPVSPVMREAGGPIVDSRRLLPGMSTGQPHGPAIPMGGQIPTSEVDARLARAAAQAPGTPPGIEVVPGIGGRSARAQSRLIGQADEAATTSAMNAEGAARSASASQMVDEDATLVLEDAAKQAAANRYATGGLILNGGIIPPLSEFKTEVGRRALRSGGMIGVGLTMQQAEDERLQATGKEIVAWGIMSALYPHFKTAGIRGGTMIRDAMSQSPTGVKVLNAMSYDILADPITKELAAEYEQIVAKGKARAAELATAARRLGPNADRRISDLIERESFESMAGEDTPQVLALAQRISDEFTAIGRAKVELGLLSPETVARHEGQYLKRIYGVHLADNVTSEVQLSGGRKVRITPDGRRLDLPDEVRNALGEVREASLRTEIGVAEGYRSIAAAHIFTKLKSVPGAILPESVMARESYQAARKAYLEAAAAKAPKQDLLDLKLAMRNAQKMEAGLAAEFAKPKAGWRRMPDTEGMGALRNMVVKEDVADYLDQLPDNQTGGKMLKLLGLWKKSKTVWNPGTHVGNMMSNVSMAHMGGLPVGKQRSALTKAWRSWAAYDDDVRFLAERGILDRGLPTFGDPQFGGTLDDKLRSLFETTRPETRSALEAGGVTPKSGLRKAYDRADHAAIAAYSKEDGVFRVALFQHLTQNKGMARGAAADFVHRQFVDYGTRSPALRTIGRYASPFVLFPAKAIPHIADQVMQYPERWLTLMAMWGGMDQWSRRQVGPMDFTDLPENERYKGYLMPGRVQIDAPMKAVGKVLGIEDEDTGIRYTIDAARWTPFSAITGSPAPGTAASQLNPKIPQVFAPSGPLLDAGTVAAGRDPYTGDELYKPWYSPEQKAKVLIGQIFKFIGPTAFTVHLPRVEEDVYNLDQKAAALDALGVFGLRPQRVAPGNQASRAEWEKRKSLVEVKSWFNREMRKAENSPDRQDELTGEYEANLMRVERNYLQQLGEYEAAKEMMQSANAAQVGVQLTPR